MALPTMGHNPRPVTAYRTPDRESFHLGIAKSAYVHDRLTVDEYERSVEHVLAGGTLDPYGEPK